MNSIIYSYLSQNSDFQQDKIFLSRISAILDPDNRGPSDEIEVILPKILENWPSRGQV